MEKTTHDIGNKIEAILFYLAEPVEIAYLVKILGVSKNEIEKAILELKESLLQRGIHLVEHDNTVSLVTAPTLSDTIDTVIKNERERELGRAGIETLSIIAYKGPISRKEIEYIRGVNSQFALRNLLLRGLIEKQNKEGNDRVMLYTITMDTLLHLGLSSVNELPEYTAVHTELSAEQVQELEEESNDISDGE
ncbi:MAG: segregation and condensation protein [Patescibacteria group bacterium]|nr:segregation and condensation protein [Patescibacteria group bacterium]